MDKQVEEKNKRKIYELIKNYFGLEKESLKLFKFNLFNEREIPEEYEFIHESPDLRVYYPLDDFLDDSCLEQTYKDYGIFRKHFINEINKFSITFENYKRNSIDHKKNKYKLIKFLFKVKILNFLKEKIAKNLNEEQKKIVDDFSERTHFKKIRDFIMSLRNEENEETKKSLEEIDFEITILDNIIKQITKIKSTTKSGLKIVVSRNFADYFMCSTKQSFTSCLNLNSDYGGAYWSGLPGLITDKNRAMVYITDGKTVEYRGIVVPKVINRSWILTARKKMIIKLKDVSEKEKYFINLVKVYPPSEGIKKSFKNFLEKVFPNRTILDSTNNTSDIIGKYYFRPIWFSDNRSCFIFQDSTRFSLGKKNKAKEMPLFYYNNFCGSGFQSIDKSGHTASEFSFNGGLKYLIENDTTMMNVDLNNECSSDEDSCENCGYTGEVYYREIFDQVLCNDCYWEEACECDSCGQEMTSEDSFSAQHEDGCYCESCFYDKFQICDDCNEYHRIDNIHLGPNDRNYCEDCFDDKFQLCDKCGDYFDHDKINENGLCEECEEEKIIKEQKEELPFPKEAQG